MMRANILSELKEYIDSTYDEHYSKNKFQATEFIIDGGHGEGFCIGNIMKLMRTTIRKERWKKPMVDLLKVIHYGIIALYINEMEERKMKLSDNTISGVEELFNNQSKSDD